MSIYEAGEVRLVDALWREFPHSFEATLRANKDRVPFVAEDGRWRIRLGKTPEVELWLDEQDVLCFGVEVGGVLHTGTAIEGELRFDGPVPLGAPELN